MEVEIYEDEELVYLVYSDLLFEVVQERFVYCLDIVD